MNRAKGQFWSIEELFRSVVGSLPLDIEPQVVTAPQVGAKLSAIWSNLRWIRRQKQSDCVHVTGDIHYAVLGVWNAPVVLTIHDLRFIDEASGLKKTLLWLFWIYLPVRFASHITVISEFTKQRLLRWTRVSADRISVVPNCVDPEYVRTERRQHVQRPIVLQVGTTDNKNLDRVIVACTGLNLMLWILGRLSEPQRAKLNEAGIEYREFHGLQRSEVVRLYIDCDVVCFASTYEGFGLPVLEAQAVGRPILTSNISPLREVAGDGALLVNPESADEIRTGLMHLIQDESLRRSLIERGLTNVKKYSSQSIAEQYSQIYRRLVELT